jgi:hypothetical protein
LEIKKYLLRCGIPENKLEQVSDGRFFVYKKMNIIIMPKYNTFSLIHEIIHLAFAVMDGRGVPIRYENDETITYYVEMVLRNVLVKLNKKI